MRKQTNLQDISDCWVLIAFQVKGHAFSQLFVNSPEAVDFCLEHILEARERKKNHSGKGSGNLSWSTKNTLKYDEDSTYSIAVMLR